ncbi:MAG: amidohydrolase [Candidatus Eremiobacteraeota bacterium]|nr:amidohydrolase [Candidatus Eremiobacteraeota bacterium]
MKRRTFFMGLGGAALAGAGVSCVVHADNERASLVLRGGAIYTARKDGAVAEAIAIAGGHILAVGARGTIDGYIGPRTRVLDLRGGMVLPGFIDTHTHFVWGSLARTRVALGDAVDERDVAQRLALYAHRHPHESWILGGDWVYGTFSADGPTKALLDRVVPDRPVALDSFDGHSMWLNSKALALAGINRATPDIKHNGRVVGVIVRDAATGEPTGVLKEEAQNLALAVVPKPTREQLLRMLQAGMRAANERGVTSVINASGDMTEMELYQTLRERGRLSLRTTTAYSNINGTPHTGTPEEFDEFEAARRRFRGDWVRAGIVKFFMDGVVEGHTAALLAPYADEPGIRGRSYYPNQKYFNMLVELDRRGFAVMTHAIGDAAVREALDGYEAAHRANGPRDRRWRVEHIEVCNPHDVPRFGTLGVVASMQPYHWCCHDERGADAWSRNLGRSRWSEGFQWRNILDGGARMVHGSDWPVVTIDPLIGIYSAITREDPSGRPPGGWFPQQRLHLSEVLAGYTREAARVAFMEDRIGTLEAGKKADLAVLQHDLRGLSPREVLDTPIRATVLDGKIVYEGERGVDRAAEIPRRSGDACVCRRFARPLPIA